MHRIGNTTFHRVSNCNYDALRVFSVIRGKPQAKFKDGGSSSMTGSTSGSHLWSSWGLFTSITQWVDHHHAPLRCSVSAMYFLMSICLLANILHNSCPTSPVCDSTSPVLTGNSPPRGATSYWIVSLTKGPYLVKYKIDSYPRAHLSTSAFLALILSGDIELNPEPHNASIYPCG